MYPQEQILKDKESLEFQIKTIDEGLKIVVDPEVKSVLQDTKYQLKEHLMRLSEQYAQNQIPNACTRCQRQSAKDETYTLCSDCRKDLRLEE